MDKNTISRKTGICRIIAAFFYSMRGFKVAFIGEAAFRQEIFLALVLSFVGWFFAESLAEFLFLLAALLFVMIVELLNSSIEKLTDLVQPKFHPLARIVKDIASAAVFLSFILSGLVWLALLVF